VDVEPVLAGLEAVHLQPETEAAGHFGERGTSDDLALSILELRAGRLCVDNGRQPDGQRHREHERGETTTSGPASRQSHEGSSFSALSTSSEEHRPRVTEGLRKKMKAARRLMALRIRLT
jgi:hypothetical protein